MGKEIDLAAVNRRWAAGERVSDAEFDAMLKANAAERRNADPKRLEVLTSKVRLQAELNSLVERESALRDLAFDREQMGRSSLEQRVHAQLNSMGMLTDGRIGNDPIVQATAHTIRYTEVMRTAHGASTEFATGLTRGFYDGVSATDALGNALKRLGDRLFDMATEDFFSQMLAPLSGGIASLLTGGAPATLTGWGATVFPSVYHRGGVAGDPNAPRRAISLGAFAGAPRYHGGGVAGYRNGLRSNEVAAAVAKARSNNPRYLQGTF